MESKLTSPDVSIHATDTLIVDKPRLAHAVKIANSIFIFKISFLYLFIIVTITIYILAAPHFNIIKKQY